MSTTTAAVIALAVEHLATLADDHDAHPWADPQAHARYATRYATTRFLSPRPNTIVALTQRGETDAAANALDYAASVLDNGDGYISTGRSTVTLYLSDLVTAGLVTTA